MELHEWQEAIKEGIKDCKTTKFEWKCYYHSTNRFWWFNDSFGSRWLYLRLEILQQHRWYLLLLLLRWNDLWCGQLIHWGTRSRSSRENIWRLAINWIEKAISPGPANVCHSSSSVERPRSQHGRHNKCWRLNDNTAGCWVDPGKALSHIRYYLCLIALLLSRIALLWSAEILMWQESISLEVASAIWCTRMGDGEWWNHFFLSQHLN